MFRFTKVLAQVMCLLLLPLPALAVPINATGFFEFDGDTRVDPFRLDFNTVIEVTDTTEFVALPLVSGSVTVGNKTFKDSVFLRFATNAFGGFGALVLSQNSNPFAGTALPDFFQISATFASGTNLQTIQSQTVSAPLLGFDYIEAGTPPTFAFGNTGVGLVTFSQPAPVPLPAGGVLLISGLGLIGGRRMLKRRVAA